ncbi:DNA cytosine methyltransferase [Providencia rettgeri]|uniref:DNA cytosine methyltransferase n=1 Tax=Providencia rettgeri TaxID=587 RepID=UPI001404F025|nr:DNA cytosine methyltransferase [Providencia rettgeri]ELQ1456471.1 DNA cytosine methyltransferase [Providencia rettgeri]NHN51419.1 DNA cytosine methyltransferase [Providencia rettgeri]HEP0305515.1 DNA cytosine methyltransferase [Providencia rettgeri]
MLSIFYVKLLRLVDYWGYYVKVVDLFCGVGGLTHGLQAAGLKVVAGYDIDQACRFAYEKNNNALFVSKSVTDIDPHELFQHFGKSDIKILAGCAPCQPFSSYSNTIDPSTKLQDKRWSLLYSFAKQIEIVQPEIVTMENVPRVINHKVFQDFTDTLKKQGYYVWFDKVYCPNYGMSQTRTRLVLLASKLGEIELIKPTHSPDSYVKLREVIGHLPKIKAGEIHKSDLLHRSSILSELNLKRIKASKPGGTWKDWPQELVANCHKKASGASYTAVYGRMHWDGLGATMTTQCTGFGNGRFGHPEQDRGISLREAALIQSFPENYQFWPEDIHMDIRTVARMIGNAVPVKLGEIIGKSIIEHIHKFN